MPSPYQTPYGNQQSRFMPPQYPPQPYGQQVSPYYPPPPPHGLYPQPPPYQPPPQYTPPAPTPTQSNLDSILSSLTNTNDNPKFTNVDDLLKFLRKSKKPTSDEIDDLKTKLKSVLSKIGIVDSSRSHSRLDETAARDSELYLDGFRDALEEIRAKIDSIKSSQLKQFSAPQKPAVKQIQSSNIPQYGSIQSSQVSGFQTVPQQVSRVPLIPVAPKQVSPSKPVTKDETPEKESKKTEEKEEKHKKPAGQIHHKSKHHANKGKHSGVKHHKRHGEPPTQKHHGRHGGHASKTHHKHRS